MKDLIRIAGQYGLTLHGYHLPDDTLGYYSPDEARIYFDLQLTPNERRSVIAHEIGHAHYGHNCDSHRNETQAETFAADLLIDPTVYAHLESICDDEHYMADELNITVELLRHYRQFCLQRLGSRTYSTHFRSRFTNQLARTLS